MQKACYHCGEPIEEEELFLEDKSFCCLGCQTVFEILSAKSLSDFYELNQSPGVKPDQSSNHQFDLLDSEEIFNQIVEFSEGGTSVVSFYVPVIHCTSCIWLLEDLNSLNPNISQSVVNFTKKTVQITFSHLDLKLSDLAKFLTKLGYKPVINLSTLEEKTKKLSRRLLYQLVVAGFCFGNIMLLAFPEYVDNNEPWLAKNKNFFRFTMFLLSLPVFFYSAQDYYKAAWQGIRNKFINIDIPIAIGILVLMLRSVYDVLLDISPGYFDSLAGLVFFMLIGKWFQQKTYESLSFERDYKSFYPIALQKINNQKEQEVILLKDLQVGDRILVRNEELIPADCILMKGKANIDNSFITGETKTIQKKVGDKVFAGGRHLGTNIELEVIADVNQSYLTSLWNNTNNKTAKEDFNTIINTISQYFTIGILLIAFFAGIFWWFYNAQELLLVVTAVLIVACPCALSLSAPFIFGNMMRIFGEKNFYIKNANVIAQLAKQQHIVFDKTGTITKNDSFTIAYVGKTLDKQEKNQISVLCNNSTHPLSQAIVRLLKCNTSQEIHDFIEEKGSGLQGRIAGDYWELGSAHFLQVLTEQESLQTQVLVKKNQEYVGKFVFQNQYRKSLPTVLTQMAKLPMSLITGDNAAEQNNLKRLFPSGSQLLFNQSPKDKLNYIKTLQNQTQKVMMIGDGLNDAGALKQSNLGIAVTNDLNNFSPASDAILDAKSFQYLPNFLRLAKQSYRLVWIAFGISFLYNIIGLGFAIGGYLEPVVAAILMPISSISVVIFATISTRLAAWKSFK